MKKTTFQTSFPTLVQRRKGFSVPMPTVRYHPTITSGTNGLTSSATKNVKSLPKTHLRKREKLVEVKLWGQIRSVDLYTFGWALGPPNPDFTLPPILLPPESL